MTISHRCRVCLCEDRRMYAMSNTVCQEIWERLTKFKFETKNGKKPLIVCYICCAHLKMSQKLMMRALKAEKLLTALIENVPEESQNKILLLASKTNDLTYKYLVKELYQLECNPLETNTVEGIKQEAEGGREEVNEEENYIKIKEEEEDSHHEDDPDINDVELDKPSDDVMLLKKMLEKECCVVLQKIDIGKSAIEHKLQQIELHKPIEDLNPLTYTDLNSQPDNKKMSDTSFLKTLSAGWNVDVTNSKQIKSTINSYQVNNIPPKHIKVETKNMFIQPNKTIIHSKVYHTESEVLKQCPPKSGAAVAPMTTSNKNEEENKSNCNKKESEKELLSHTIQYQSATKTDLNTQLPEFSGVKPYMCKFCDYRFARKPELNTHIKYVHIKVKKFSYETCDYNRVITGELCKHIHRHTGDKPYQCYLCDYKCSEKYCLNDLTLKHRKVKKFKCDMCEYKCVNKDKLVEHIRKHTGEKPYKCGLCDFRCSRKYHLLSHGRYIHTKERKFTCDMCQNKFVTLSCLKRHLRTHTGEKPYICDVCNNRYADRSTLRVHIISKHVKKIRRKN